MPSQNNKDSTGGRVGSGLWKQPAKNSAVDSVAMVWYLLLMAHAPVSAETVREFLSFDPDSGKLFWKPRDRKWFSWDRSFNSFHSSVAGKEAFTSLTHANSDKFYRSGKIMGRTYHAHRVAWAIAHGEWPRHTVDHINGDGCDNRLCNLREATMAQNQANLRPRRNKTSGLPKGVRQSRNGKFVARIKKNGKSHHLGTFLDPQSAANAYVDAADDLFGEFAYHNRPTE